MKKKKKINKALLVGRMPMEQVLFVRGYAAVHGHKGYDRKKEKINLRKEL